MSGLRHRAMGVFLWVAAGWMFFCYVLPGTALADGMEQQPALEAAEHGRVAALREQLCLRNEHLAAAGLSQAQGELLLKAFRDWFVTNKEQLASAQQAVNQAKQQLHLAWRNVRKGQVHPHPALDSARATLPHRGGGVQAAALRNRWRHGFHG